MLPDMLLKIDYGRWMFAIIAYYCVMLLALHAMGRCLREGRLCPYTGAGQDTPVPGAGHADVSPGISAFFEDVSINSVTEGLADLVNEGLHLGWWNMRGTVRLKTASRQKKTAYRNFSQGSRCWRFC